jgi:hypothetical protein
MPLQGASPDNPHHHLIRASVKIPKSWETLDQSLTILETGNYSGLGFMITPEKARSGAVLSTWSGVHPSRCQAGRSARSPQRSVPAGALPAHESRPSSLAHPSRPASSTPPRHPLTPPTALPTGLWSARRRVGTSSIDTISAPSPSSTSSSIP